MMNDLQIQHYPPQRLIPYARNARTHADEQISQIAGSIAEFGFINPILVGEDNVIIAGHGRLMAAQRLGLKTVPVIMLAHLSETQRRALVIADNKIAENAGWDEEMLRLELQALREADFDLDITGFDFEDIDRLLNGEAFFQKLFKLYGLHAPGKTSSLAGLHLVLDLKGLLVNLLLSLL
jgi:ParB-like chromosome segregation protein Spo0J